MRIKVLLVGKVREKYLRDGINEYLKRLGPYAKVELVQLADEPMPEKATAAEEEQGRGREGARLLKAAAGYLVALDLRGEQYSSEQFAAFLAERALRGQSRLSFLIGGSTGLAPEVTRQAGHLLSLGAMTLPHQMVPLVLLEQLYRSFKINAGEPYHK